MLTREDYTTNPSNGFQSRHTTLKEDEDKSFEDGRRFLLKKWEEWQLKVIKPIVLYFLKTNPERLLDRIGNVEGKKLRFS